MQLGISVRPVEDGESQPLGMGTPRRQQRQDPANQDDAGSCRHSDLPEKPRAFFTTHQGRTCSKYGSRNRAAQCATAASRFRRRP